MADVVLVYPYFYKLAKDTSIFKFPPLGLGYIASSLRDKGISVELLDGTFSDPETLTVKILSKRPSVIGYYVMITMEQAALTLADRLRGHASLQVAGGPYPSAVPELFLDSFDLVSVGEGEDAMHEIVAASSRGQGFENVKGLVYRDGGGYVRTGRRQRIGDIDAISEPSRDLFDEPAYKDYWKKHYGYTVTSMITSRGCPFRCGFCSKPVFGDKCKQRSASGIVGEMQDIEEAGYDRIWIADDCFTLDKARIKEVCRMITERGLKIRWECLSRVDGIDRETLDYMKAAGCDRVFFGLESGSDMMLRAMKKGTSAADGVRAVEMSLESRLKTGGFFILGYPGETNDTLVESVDYSSRLGLDYLSYTVPYPIPGTDLYKQVAPLLNRKPWTSPKSHKLLFQSHFSIVKLKAAMAKGLTQNGLKKRFGKAGDVAEAVFRYLTDRIIRLIP